jgi:hypothetical protein
LFVTGIGDERNEPPESRVAGFLTSRGDRDKILLWNTVREAGHDTMNLDECGVVEGVDLAEHCEWIGAAGVAWFDALLRDRREAKRWLASDAVEILSGRKLEIYRR